MITKKYRRIINIIAHIILITIMLPFAAVVFAVVGLCAMLDNWENSI